jgi:hypothetical protein
LAGFLGLGLQDIIALSWGGRVDPNQCQPWHAAPVFKSWNDKMLDIDPEKRALSSFKRACRGQGNIVPE